MIYQWGACKPFPAREKAAISVDLRQIVGLGLGLRILRNTPGLDELLKGLRNPAQFLDACFEVEAAVWFRSLPATKEIVLSPRYMVRGKRKMADLEVRGEIGATAVECKQVERPSGSGRRRLQRLVDGLRTAMRLESWPPPYRLEVSLIKPVRGDMAVACRQILREAAERLGSGVDSFDWNETVRVHIARRGTPFSPRQEREEIRVLELPPNRAVGMLDDELPVLVVSTSIETFLKRTAADRISEAIRQLPSTLDCGILLKGIGAAVVRQLWEVRFTDPAYSHVRFMANWNSPECSVVCRPEDEKRISRLFGTSSAIR
jgi:hypothetical protein